MKFKRILALALSLMMVFSGAASIFAADTEATEVKADSPYLAAAEALNTIGVVKGDGEDYKLDDNVTRWQMALFIDRSITGKVDDSYWGNTANDYSAFTDITGTASNYLGAIGYANQKGIIKGWNDAATGKLVFNPDGGIMYQDALTMATRALGYTNLAYPWGNIEKAIELGLDDGISEVGYQDELTRGEVIQVIYNMLIAKVEGSDKTLRETVFGITEAVIVIVASEDVIYTSENEKLNRENYVSFQVLGSDGLPTGKVYSISAAKLGIKDTDAAVGDSYFVTTINNYEDIVTYEKGASETLWNLGTSKVAYETTTFNKDTKKQYDKVVIVNEDDKKDLSNNYSLVKEYTYLRTIQGSKTGVETIPGDLELLVYYPSQSTYGVEVSKDFYRNFYGDILRPVKNETSGTVVYDFEIAYAYNQITDSYFKQSTTSTGVVYYTPISLDDIKKDTSVAVSKETIVTEKNSFKITTSLETPAYSSLKLIDDYTKYEGYDRAIYKNYGLMKYTEYDKDGETRVKLEYSEKGIIKDGLNKAYIAGDYKLSEFKKYYSIVDAISYESDKLDGKGEFFLGYYNYQTNTIEVLEHLTVETGILKGWTDGGSVTIGSEKFTANYSGLKHAAVLFNDNTKAANVSSLLGLYTKSVKYIVIDDQIVYITDDTAEGNAVVVLDAFIGVTADGYYEFYAYTTYAPGSRVKIQVTSINGMYLGGISSSTWGWTSSALATSWSSLFNTAYKATVDSNGRYFITGTPANATDTLKFNQFGLGYFTTKVTLQNGGVSNFNAKSSTYFVIIDSNSKIWTAKGIPADGTTITGTFYFANENMVVCKTATAGLPTGLNNASQKEYYWVGSDYTSLGQTGNSSVYSPEFTYTKLWNMRTAKADTSLITSNILLPQNTIVEVVDGVVTNTTAITLAQVITYYKTTLTSTTAGQETTAAVSVAAKTAVGTIKDKFEAAIKAKIALVEPSVISTVTTEGYTFKKINAASTVISDISYADYYKLLDANYTITFSYIYDYRTLKVVVYVETIDSYTAPAAANHEMVYNAASDDIEFPAYVKETIGSGKSVVTVTCTNSANHFQPTAAGVAAGTTLYTVDKSLLGVTRLVEQTNIVGYVSAITANSATATITLKLYNTSTSAYVDYQLPAGDYAIAIGIVDGLGNTYDTNGEIVNGQLEQNCYFFTVPAAN